MRGSIRGESARYPEFLDDLLSFISTNAEEQLSVRRSRHFKQLSIDTTDENVHFVTKCAPLRLALAFGALRVAQRRVASQKPG